MSLTGSQLWGDSEASGGGANNSASNLPLLQLQRLDDGAVSWLTPSTSTDTSYTSTALPSAPVPSGAYLLTAFVNGIASDAIFMNGPQVPGAPGSITPTAGNASVQLSFAAPSDDGGATVTEYLVKAYAATDMTTVVAQSNCTSTSCTVTGLGNGTSYVFTVQAVNAVGEGYITQSAPVTPNPVPDAPTAVTAVAGDGQVTVSWAAPTNTGGTAITGYTATATTTGTPPQVAGTCSTSATPPDMPATSCTITGLTNGTAYNFSVVASSSAGVGASASSATPVAPIASVNVPDSTNLPAGTVGESYSASIMPAGGTAPYHFSITAGSLPQGLSAAMSSDGMTIIITGTPSQSETANFTLTISDSTVPVVQSARLNKAGPTVPTVVQAYSITVAAAPVVGPANATPVPLFGEWWEKLLLSLTVVGGAALCLRMRMRTAA